MDSGGTSSRKEAWRHAWCGLDSTCARLEADICKQRDAPLLKGVLLPEPAAAPPPGSVLRPVTEARQQLAELQQLVSGEEGQANAAFITALSDRITCFTQQLSSIKQQQRRDYSALLHEEQQLLEELAVLELTLQDDHSADSSSLGAVVAAGAAPELGSSLQSTEDCVCRSPDRPHRQGGTHSTHSSSSPGKKQQPHASTPPAPAPANNTSSSHSSSSSLPPEVESYDAFVARHGPCGGWHPEDHKTFMAILKAHRGDCNAALAAAVDALPLQSRQSVIAHCRWHADLCELDMRKRIALVNWRTAKEAAKAAFRAQAVALGDNGGGSGSAGNCGLATCAALPQLTDQQEKEARQAKQQLLQQWKQEQQAAREEAARVAREQYLLQQQQDRQRRQQRQEELKQRLQEARASKQQQEQEQEEAAAAAKQQSQLLSSDPEQRQRLQQRSSATLERQRQLLAAKQERQAARQRAQQQLLAATQGMRPQVERDPSRLLAATTSAAARAAAAVLAAAEAKAEAQARGSRGHAAGGFVLHAGHRRATPGWAAGVQGL